MTAPAVATAQLALHRAAANAYYRKAIETDEHLDAVALHQWAMRERAQLPPTPQLPMPHSLDDSLDEWREIAKKLAADERDRSAEHKALTALINSTENRIQSGLHEPDRIIFSLAADHDQIMGNIAEVVAQLDGAGTATQAIKLGVSDAWAALEPLCDELDSVVAAYFWAVPPDLVIHSRSEYLEDDLATDLRIANLDTVFPAWKHAPRNTAIQRWDDTRRPQPWPEDRLEAAVWMCTSGAQMRLATTRQVRDLWAQRRRDRAHPNGLPHQQQTARHELNQAPRAGYFDRVAVEVEPVARPIDLDLIEPVLETTETTTAPTELDELGALTE